MKLKQGLIKFDWSLILATFILTLIGITSIFSSNSYLNINQFGEHKPSLYSNQLIYLLIAIFVVVILSQINVDILLNYSFFIYSFGIILLILTLVLGLELNQAKSWINLGFISFQPSEFMKVFFILYLAYFLGKKSIINFKDIIMSGFVFLIPFVLILLQPDLGTATVYFFIWLIMLLSSNTSSKNKFLLSASMLVGIIVLLLSVYFNLIPLSDYQLSRLKVYPSHLFLEDSYHSGIGYQVDQSLIAIGSSSMKGKGLGLGTQTQLGFLPETETDFIFSSLTEELGIIIALIIILLYSFLIWRLYMISTLNISSSRHLLVIGVISMISVHIIQNTGMNIGFLPVSGIPLPFVSLGGSFLLTLFASIGLLESIIINKN